MCVRAHMWCVSLRVCDCVSVCVCVFMCVCVYVCVCVCAIYLTERWVCDEAKYKVVGVKEQRQKIDGLLIFAVDAPQNEVEELFEFRVLGEYAAQLAEAHLVYDVPIHDCIPKLHCQTHTRTQAHTHVHTRTYTCTHTCVHARAHTYI